MKKASQRFDSFQRNPSQWISEEDICNGSKIQTPIAEHHIHPLLRNANAMAIARTIANEAAKPGHARQDMPRHEVTLRRFRRRACFRKPSVQ
jgi:hypothetical protein